MGKGSWRGRRPMVLYLTLSLLVASAATMGFMRSAAASDTLIFAAASTAVALDAAIADYASSTTSAVRVSYASSGALARQIEHGAPADLYLSANTAWIDWAEKRGLLAPASQRILFRNRLVLIEPVPDPQMIKPIYRDIINHEWLNFKNN